MVAKVKARVKTKPFTAKHRSYTSLVTEKKQKKDKINVAVG